MDRTTADYMGNKTAINSIALQHFLEKEGLTTRVQSALAGIGCRALGSKKSLCDI